MVAADLIDVNKPLNRLLLGAPEAKLAAIFKPVLLGEPEFEKALGHQAGALVFLFTPGSDSGFDFLVKRNCSHRYPVTRGTI